MKISDADGYIELVIGTADGQIQILSLITEGGASHWDPRSSLSPPSTPNQYFFDNQSASNSSLRKIEPPLSPTKQSSAKSSPTRPVSSRLFSSKTENSETPPHNTIHPNQQSGKFKNVSSELMESLIAEVATKKNK